MREKIAWEQHAIWSHWMKYLFQCSSLLKDDSILIPADKAKRWKRQAKTPYHLLSKDEKESDRHQADKIIHIMLFKLVQVIGPVYLLMELPFRGVMPMVVVQLI